MKIQFVSILITFLFVSLCVGNTITFYEENLIPKQIVSYSDNSIVFRLISRLNNTCNAPNLIYRILYPNGTNNLITIYDHQIPPFNFCMNDKRDQVRFFETIPNYILVLYYKITEENNTLLTFGMMIDWSGKITR